MGRADTSLIALTVLFVLSGVLMVFDTTYFYSKTYASGGYSMLMKHLVSVLIGGGLVWFFSRLRSAQLETYARHVLAGAAVLLTFTHLPGVQSCANGACRWVSVGFMNFQPAELVKFAFVIFMASELAHKDDEEIISWRYTIFPLLGATLALQLVLIAQPDFGATVLLAVLAFSLLFLGGVPFRRLAVLLAPCVALAVVLVRLEPYRLKRFLCFLDPWVESTGACYQLVQSFRTFASGGITGIGLGSSLQKTGWLPEAHTDFVFAVIGEESGLIGAYAVLMLFCVFGYRGFRIAHRHSQQFGQLLAAGLTLIIVTQALINMGVVLGLLPTKGLVLPFLSYGGSSMLITLASVGVLIGLSREIRES